MSANVKKWMNRGGLVAVVVGLVLIGTAGGDPEAAIGTGQAIAGIVVAGIGAIGTFIREVLN